MTRPPINDINNKEGLINLGPIPSLAPVASFNLNQIENLLQTKAFLAWHLKHAPNPDRVDIGGPVNPNTNAAQRGIYYYDVRAIGVIPQRFQFEDRMMAQGIWGVGSVLFNITGEYLDDIPNKSKITHVRNRDLIVMNQTITTMVDQLFEYNPNGPQKLHYKIKGVDYLADNKREYHQGTDFFVNSVGQIEWIQGGNKPDFKNGKGSILTCVYYITPIYIVQSLPHQLRIIPSNEIGHAALPREASYAPQLLVAKPSTIIEEKDGILNDLNQLYDWHSLPNFPDYPESLNMTGGSI